MTTILLPGRGKMSSPASKGQIILGTHTAYADTADSATFITGIGGKTSASVLLQYSNAQNTSWSTQLDNYAQSGAWSSWPGPKCYSIAGQIAGTPLTWTDVTSGANDSYFNTALTYLHNNGIKFLRPMWEFNQTDASYPWGVRNNDTSGNQAGFIAVHQHIVDLAEAIAPGYFTYIWNFSNGVNSPLADAFTNYYPGDAYVDIVGMDIYVHTPSAWPGDATFLSDLQTGNDPNWNDMVTFANAHGKALAVPEFGMQPTSSTSPGDDATSCTNVCNLASSAAGTGATVYFWPYNGGNTFATSYPNSYAALQTWVAAQVAAGYIA